MGRFQKGKSGNEGTQFRKGVSGNPAGRPKKLVNVIKDLPADQQEKVYGVLSYALTLPDETTARTYLEYQAGELGKYGFVLQIVIKQLLKEGWGFSALMDIMDRLYGRPKVSAEVETTGDGVTIVVRTAEEKDKIENLGSLGV